MAITVLLHSDLSGAERLGAKLRDYGHRLDFRKLHHGEKVPSDLDGVDGIISCGGGACPNDDSLPWISDELAFLRAASEAEVPLVGLCLGNQLLARALGGTVEKMEAGPEIGWTEVRQTDMGKVDVLHAGIGWATMQPQWHSMTIKDLPAGATVLAESDKCPVQAWVHGVRSYGFQYHPEIGTETLDVWAADEPQAIIDANTTLEDIRAASAAHYPTFQRLSDRLFENIGLLLMPVDRRFQGAIKDLHH